MITYSDGFERAWKHYPHYQTRSKKLAAYRVWMRGGLEPLTDSVIAWIDHHAAGDDWTREGGKYIPGMQVWMRSMDFDLTTPPVGYPDTEPRGYEAQLRDGYDENNAGMFLDPDERDRYQRWLGKTNTPPTIASLRQWIETCR